MIASGHLGESRFIQFKTAMRTLAVLGRFGKAYLDDARAYIQTTYEGPGTKPVRAAHWNLWDNLLEDACTRLKAESGSRRDCTPDDQE